MSKLADEDELQQDVREIRERKLQQDVLEIRERMRKIARPGIGSKVMLGVTAGGLIGATYMLRGRIPLPGIGQRLRQSKV
jgi:DNA-binding IclR family transcriptional regulator